MRSTSSRQQEASTVEPAWPPPQGEWTYEDWCKLPDDGYRYEVITGVLYVSPPPAIRHQRISIALVGHLLDFLKLQPLGVEERLLRTQFGDEYSAYCARTSRLIPGLY